MPKKLGVIVVASVLIGMSTGVNAQMHQDSQGRWVNSAGNPDGDAFYRRDGSLGFRSQGDDVQNGYVVVRMGKRI